MHDPAARRLSVWENWEPAASGLDAQGLTLGEQARAALALVDALCADDVIGTLHARAAAIRAGQDPCEAAAAYAPPGRGETRARRVLAPVLAAAAESPGPREARLAMLAALGLPSASLRRLDGEGRAVPKPPTRPGAPDHDGDPRPDRRHRPHGTRTDTLQRGALLLARRGAGLCTECGEPFPGRVTVWTLRGGADRDPYDLSAVSDCCESCHAAGTADARKARASGRREARRELLGALPPVSRPG